MISMQKLCLLVPLAPLAGAVLVGLFGRFMGRIVSHSLAILGVAASFVASLLIFREVAAGAVFNDGLYTWANSGDLHFELGFLVDSLSVTMMLIVSFVSLMVHIYSVGYMRGDAGYTRFFSYISLFTFAMLMLVMSNNFLQLFFGWEAVGLVSYLLIGFWFERPSAAAASLKAFLVNRVGDFGFLLAIGLIAAFAGSLDYHEVFAQAGELQAGLVPGTSWPLLTAICIGLFVGAMGKSAQIPLHVWLPDSMEGPTPISALIHAATMVTAGIFMVARMSPLFELSETALSFIMVIGATTALFMGLVGIVQNDIKRVVAYSTLSQLGYMTVALGVSAYPAAVFHLTTHAFFKALLFLGAGSVILGLHHEQDMRRMGGLGKYMKLTWMTTLIGALALIGFPFTSGFYSKESIIQIVVHSGRWGAGYASLCVTAGVFVTAFYTFRMFFLVFHGQERFDKEKGKPHEPGWAVTLPLVLLAIPSLVAGFFMLEPMLHGAWLEGAIAPGGRAAHGYFHGPAAMALHDFLSPPFWFALAGVLLAWFLYLKRPDLPAAIQKRFAFFYRILDNKYYFDRFNEIVFAGGARLLGRGLWKLGDEGLIDGVLVNGSARFVGGVGQLVRLLQSGLIYLYAFWIVIGLVILLVFWLPYLRAGWQ